MTHFFKIACLLCLVQASFAQQQPVFTNFLINDYFYNPAIAGSKNAHIANVSYRDQWVGFDGAPTTLIGNFYGSVRNEGKMGYGATVISDRTGLIQNTSIYVNYAHHFKLSETLKLGLGVRPGYMQYRIKLYDVQLADEGDNLLIGNVLSANAFDIQGGFHLYSNRFFVMGSVQNLLGDAIGFTSYNANLTKHYTFIGGYTFKFEKKKIELQPSVLLRNTTSIPMQTAFMLKGIYAKNYWGGLTYTTDNTMGAYIGYTLKERLSIAYGFDFPFNGIEQYQSGSHELSISYVINAKKANADTQDEALNKSILEDMKMQLEKRKKDK